VVALGRARAREDCNKVSHADKACLLNKTDFKIFSVMLFCPECDQDDHPFAPIAAYDAAQNAAQTSDLPFDNDSDADNEHDLADDQDLFEQT